jgi:DNA-binding response OmpR family regulator
VRVESYSSRVVVGIVVTLRGIFWRGAWHCRSCAGHGGVPPAFETKPFSPKELVARVRAIFRRVDAGPERGEVVRAGDVTIDRQRMVVTVRGRTVDLTATELALVAKLASQPGRVFTRTQLLDAIGGGGESFDRVIDAHVKNVRRKLEPDPREPRYVLTVHGVGYKFAG